MLHIEEYGTILDASNNSIELVLVTQNKMEQVLLCYMRNAGQFCPCYKRDLIRVDKGILTTCAVVPSGSVMMGLLGSTWISDTVPSGFVMVCSTAGAYWDIWKMTKYNIQFIYQMTK